VDTRQLRYFLAVVDEGGFGRAAEQLFIAQPSLSQTIAGLERDLGVTLFHRVGRSVVLSDAGRTLVGPARLVLRDLEAARASVDALRGVRSGKLDLTTMPSPGIEPLTTLIAQFIAQHPLVTLNIEGVFTPGDVLAAVRSGACELGLTGAREPVRAAGVDVLHLEEQPLVLIVSPALDTFGDRTSLGPENLSGHRVIVSQQGSLMRWMVDDVLAGGVDCEIVAEVAHRTSILPMVMSGIGHAVLPSAWRQLAERTGLRALTITPEVALHVALLSRTSGLSPAARSVLEMARTYSTRHR
jgi:DNA-binding transcriptional LysR family regulator